MPYITETQHETCICINNSHSKMTDNTLHVKILKQCQKKKEKKNEKITCEKFFCAELCYM